jgi:hypothetical protein
MFDANSRYVNGQIVEVETAQGKRVHAVKLRRLPYVAGNLTEVKGNDRLDIMAYRHYKDGTKFWHIADANTALEAHDPVEQKPPANPLADNETTFIFVPEN